MGRIIDASQNLTPYVDTLLRGGVTTVIRYYNLRNGPAHPTKCLTREEARTFASVGLNLAVVFQQNGGHGGQISDFTEATGARDGARALDLAGNLEQPDGSAIYFAVDHDFIHEAEATSIAGYFRQVKAALTHRYRVGVYGSGWIGQKMTSAGCADLVWLAAGSKWKGTQAALARGDYALRQLPEQIWPEHGFGYDENKIGPLYGDFGQFRVGESAPVRERLRGSPAIYAVRARRGLNLRRGPGPEFDVIETLQEGSLVHALGHSNEWILVDCRDDGQADGYLFGGFLEPIAGVLQDPVMPGTTPYAIARGEMQAGVSEVPGKASNPRIVTYHATTSIGPAEDGVAWCSSFVNFCVTRAGLHGTNSAWAMSWDSDDIGPDVSGSAQPGDIAVFRRTWTQGGVKKTGGHVGFLVSQTQDSIELLGGNQGNRVRIAHYPKNGDLGGQHYELLSIRRVGSGHAE